ncbi:uncharacterized protein MELLADRAFT_116677 [Melampsora larici-populina 98AG31]|uniref:Carrier domain-containing protein n=1 Tax=Melampsora larici-populina (strain 98AG31 / pathotype 3-4-7) TaxID=747676 RepID=F4RP16_MELLP|nr:uncharacterized protein MELLADRAFT_116677 [Melampsora larici-populina 98AG31]EGG05932.1 hypothetical protein MELLADRAFT_116677 [Melampsora larici-populina 98AG31]
MTFTLDSASTWKDRHSKDKFPKFQKPDLDDPGLTPEKLVDFHVTHNPNYPFAILPASENHHAENDIITWNEIGNTVINIARDLSSAGSAPTDACPRPVVGIIAYSEPLVYFTVILALMRAGCIPFAISPRNSPAAITHLLQSSGCQSLYVEFNPQLLTQDVHNMSTGEKISREQMDEVLKLLPEFHLLKLLELPTAHSLFPRLFSQSAHQFDADVPQKLASISAPLRSPCEPIMILHSSGTTAFPKIIYLNPAVLQSWMKCPLYNSFCWEGELTAAMVLPAFHSMGFHFGSLINLSTGCISGHFRPELGPDGRCKPKVPNSFNILEAIRSLGCTVASFSPMMLTDYASDPSSVEALRNLKRVGIGGGPLSTEIGNHLIKGGVKLCMMYGATEVGPISALLSEHCLGENWEYFEMSPQLTTRLIPHENDLLELVILSSDKHRCASTVIETALSPQTYHTNDLICKHPTLPLYRVVGRVDDQIMLSNSEKTNPGPMEAIMSFNPAIKSALMFGRGKPQNGVILEPEESHAIDITNEEAMEAYIDLIWPSIAEANKFGPSHSRLTRELIMVIDPRITPLPRTPKGQISRYKALEMFKDQIEAIYTQDQKSSPSSLEEAFDASGAVISESVRECVKKIVNKHLNCDVNAEEDLFTQGCDSLHARQIRAQIVQLMNSGPNSLITVPHNIMYRYPSIAKLSDWIISILSHTPLLNPKSEELCESLKKMILKYSPKVSVRVEV